MKKYFYYDCNGNKERGFSLSTVLISEGLLPDFSEKHKGKCSFSSKNILLKSTPIGSIIDVAFGEPRIVKRCKLIAWILDGAPDKMLKDAQETRFEGVTLEYEGKKIWAYRNWLCLEKDLR